jgi:hypothetical protein
MAGANVFSTINPARDITLCGAQAELVRQASV